MPMSLRKLVLWVVLAAPSVAVAQSIEQTDTTIALPEVVHVTAARMELKGANSAQAVSQMNRDQLVRLAPMSTPDALASMAGVWMQKTNLGGGAPFIRGLTGYHSLLLVDGIRFNNSTFRSGPNQYLNTIDPFTISRIEVLRGLGSVQYGSDALGGVAQLFFQEPAFEENLKVKGGLLVRYADHNMDYTGRVEAGIHSANFALLGGVSYNRFGDIKAGGGLGTLQPTGFNQNSWDVKSRAKLGNKMITAAWQHLVQHNVPLNHQIASGVYSRYHFAPQQRDFGYVRLESFYNSKVVSRMRATVAYLNSVEVREKQKTGSTVFRTERDRVDTGHGAIEVLSDFLPQWKASSGIEYYFDYVNSSASDYNEVSKEKDPVRGLYPDGTVYHNGALFSMHSIDVNRFNISVGARYNLLRLNVSDTLFGNTILKPKALVGHAGMVYKAFKTLHVLASVSTGFRAPNVNDIASFGIADYRYEVPNFDLGPEKSLQYQLGLRAVTPHWRAELQVYRNELSQLISNVASTFQGQDSLDGFKVYKKENINEARIQGFEFDMHAQPLHKVHAFANLTYTLGNNITRQEPLSRIPPLFATIGVDWMIAKSFTWRVEALNASKQDRLSSGDKGDIRIKTGGTPGWVVSNTRMEFRSSHVRINVGVRNIFNQAYRIHGSGVDGIGRNFWISVAVNI